MEQGKIYILHHIGKTELTPEQAKELLEGTELPPNMRKIIEGESGMDSKDQQIQDLSYENIKYRQHIDKLTKQLEIAEKALEQFSRGKFHRSIVENTWGPMVHIEEKPWDIAEKALQQLRK